MKSKQSLWIILTVVLLIMVAVAVFYILRQQAQMKDLQQQSELVKEELADEYNELVIDYEGFRMRISNDSLLAELDKKQMQVERLQEELRTVKATNTRRINELRKELETMQGILKHYIQQMDSLNKINEKLITENRQMNTRLRQSNETVSQLTKANEQLLETVTFASRLNASNITVTGLNDKNRPTNETKKMQKLEFKFLIDKNITATPGEKTIYIRIMEPNDDVLIKSRSDVFVFENKEINYSEKRIIEYGGEEYPVIIYWDILKFLTLDTYCVDIFADGNRIGRKFFKFDKK